MNATTFNRTTRECPLPKWANSDCQWTLGGELEPGDTIYPSSFADPRKLDVRLQPDFWRGTAIVRSFYSPRKTVPNQLVEIDVDHWYVVKRVGQL